MSDYSLIAVVCFVMVAAVVMAYCQREETDANAELNRFGFKVSYIRNWFVFVTCVVVICFSMGTTASAGQSDPEWNPPKRFDHSYGGNLHLHRVPVEDVRKTCQAMADFYGYKSDNPNHGCAHMDKTFCEVVIPLGNVQKATPAAILRHEMGHCVGWPANHPD